MPDYECPDCGGGFPGRGSSRPDECPWCGKAMGDAGPTIGAPINTLPSSTIGDRAVADSPDLTITDQPFEPGGGL